MKTMTKEQAEKAAMEFAWKKINDGLAVWRTDNHNEIRIDFDTRHTSFPFVDLVPGDACLVWNDNQSEIIMLFSCADEDGSLLFSKRIANVIAGVGTYYTNYRKLDFNVLKIVKGWGDGD